MDHRTICQKTRHSASFVDQYSASAMPCVISYPKFVGKPVNRRKAIYAVGYISITWAAWTWVEMRFGMFWLNHSFLCIAGKAVVVVDPDRPVISHSDGRYQLIRIAWKDSKRQWFYNGTVVEHWFYRRLFCTNQIAPISIALHCHFHWEWRSFWGKRGGGTTPRDLGIYFMPEAVKVPLRDFSLCIN